MSRITFWGSLVLFVGFIVGIAAPARAGDASSQDAEKTLSPYFVVENGDPSLDRLPLESTRVEVAVSSVIADVTVTQVYENAGKRPINARYVFPASTRAAVHGMRMTIRNQVIEAQIQEKKEAQRTFEKAKREGKSASLLEQERPNVFTMSVANVMPGDRIEVSLRYTELLVPTEGTYELVYPTVVGPRYSNLAQASAPKSESWLKSAFSGAGEAPTYDFALSGTLSSGIPLAALESPSHRLQRTPEGDKRMRFALDTSEKKGGNRDFILRYRLAGDAIQSGLTLYDGGAEKFFLLQVEPPARVTNDAVPPREYVFVIDVSGSMHGFPLGTAKALMRDLVGGLRAVDKFNVLLFSGDSRVLSPRSLPATQANLQAALDLLGAESGSGSTELLPALQHALSLSPEPGLSRSFIVITDGYVQADREALEFVKKNLGQANVFSFGIGSGVNRFLIEGLARAGSGEPFVVTEPGEARNTAKRFGDYVRSPVLTDVKVAYDGFDAYDMEPRAVPDVLARRPVVVFGKWRGQPGGAIRVSGVGGRGAFSQRFEVSSAGRPDQRALSYLWARKRIEGLSDLAFGDPPEAEKKEVLNLGLRYNLLTQYTSFVAVAHVVRNTSGSATDVDQPLPLPAGVSNRAIGGDLSTAAEPELFVLVALFVLVFGGLLLLRAGQRARIAA